MIAGAFRLPAVLPGSYHLAVYVAGRVVLRTPEIVLRAGEDHDAGSLEIEQQGSVRVELDLQAGVDPAGVRFLAIDGERWYRFALRREGERFLASGLPPGSYTLLAMRGNVATVAKRFEVRSGEETSITVLLESGARREFLLHVREGQVDWSQVSVKVLDERGTTLFEGSGAYADHESSPETFAYAFPRGRFEVQIRCGDLTSVRVIEITDLEPVNEPIVLELAP